MFNDLKETDARKLLQEYKFHRESSLRSLQYNRMSLGLTCFIVASSLIQFSFKPTYASLMATIASIFTAFGGIFFIYQSFKPGGKADKIAQENEEVASELENRFRE